MTQNQENNMAALLSQLDRLDAQHKAYRDADDSADEFLCLGLFKSGSVQCWPSLSSQVRALIHERDELQRKCDALLLQAECQAQEMRTQRSIVRDVYQLCTGSTGEPGDWNGAEPVRALIEERDALREALESIKECMGGADGTEGFNSPEDVWGIARAALSRSGGAT